MTASYDIGSTAEESVLRTDMYPLTLSAAEYDDLKQAIGVIAALWYLEEAYDTVLQNAIELETDVARLLANARANISSFPEEVDIELRLLNRRLTNFLAGARAFVDSVQAVLVHAPQPVCDKAPTFKQFLSDQFDTNFSYRLMEALRNYTQHQSAAISQALVMGRTWHSRDDSRHFLSVVPQIEREALAQNKKLSAKVRREISESCEDMIDLMPHLNAYVQCLGKIVDKGRALYEPEYKVALHAQTTLLKGHLTGDWAAAWVTPRGDAERHQTLFTSTHDLGRLGRIRLRNTAREPDKG
jgi:hypothetical protein